MRMENKKEKATPNVSVGADTEQPIQKIIVYPSMRKISRALRKYREKCS